VIALFYLGNRRGPFPHSRRGSCATRTFDYTSYNSRPESIHPTRWTGNLRRSH
jgi:hypothetical protein